MLEDMRMRKMTEHTQEGYVRAVRKLAAFLHRSPDAADAEDLRRFQLYLAETGTGPVTINATLTALRFFFEVTVQRRDVLSKVQSGARLARCRSSSVARRSRDCWLQATIASM